MNADIASKIVTPPTQAPVASPESAGESSGAKGPDFRQRLGNTPDAAPQAIDPAASARQVNGATLPDQQELFGSFEKVRADFDKYLQSGASLDKLVADGKLKPTDPKVVQRRREEMRMLLHFQTEMQSSSMKVEIASKVVDHATSGVKQVLSTQA